MRFFPITLIFAAMVFSSCSVLVGNVKPVDEKSENYGVADLSKENADWVRVEGEKSAKSAETNTEVADVAFQSKQTASIISLNSACRPYLDESEDLRTL